MQRSRSTREGYLGLFSLLGLISFGVFIFWISGGQFGTKTYTINARFRYANGIKDGTAVNYRGVLVGSVTKIFPDTERVEVSLKINDNVKIPIGSKIEIQHSGLLGESSIEITPTYVEPQIIAKINPIGAACNRQIIICDNSQVEGESETQIFANLGHLAEAVTDLTNNLNRISKRFDKKLDAVSDVTIKTAKSIDKTANNASKVSTTLNDLLVENHTNITKTITETKDLLATLQQITTENRYNISRTIVSIEKTSKDVDQVALELNSTVKQTNKFLKSAESAHILGNLDKILASTVETSNNLRNISRTFNDPKTILKIQETLDSARTTFQNTQKITSDLDELTGDPKFRRNLRRLVDGLGNLVSTTENLDEQIKLSQSLEATRRSIKPLNSFSSNYTKLQGQTY